MTVYCPLKQNAVFAHTVPVEGEGVEWSGRAGVVCLTMYHTQRKATANASDIIYSLNYIHKQGGREVQ